MPQIDHYDDNAPGLDSPASDAANVTPSDTTDLPVKPRAIYVNGAGDMAVVMNGATVTLTVPAGTLLPIRPVRILETGTTATGIVALW